MDRTPTPTDRRRPRPASSIVGIVVVLIAAAAAFFVAFPGTPVVEVEFRGENVRFTALPDGGASTGSLSVRLALVPRSLPLTGPRLESPNSNIAGPEWCRAALPEHTFRGVAGSSYGTEFCTLNLETAAPDGTSEFLFVLIHQPTDGEPRGTAFRIRAPESYSLSNTALQYGTVHLDEDEFPDPTDGSSQLTNTSAFTDVPERIVLTYGPPKEEAAEPR